MKREDFGLYSAYGLFINGQWSSASGGEVREVIDPTNLASHITLGALQLAAPNRCPSA
jgi:hypothetical protein